MRSLGFVMGIVLLFALAGLAFGQDAIKVSQIPVPPIKTINAPALPDAKPFVMGLFSGRRTRVAICLVGANGKVTALSPYTEVPAGQDWRGVYLRVPSKGFTNAVGFMAWVNWPDHPQWSSLWFPCTPEGTETFRYHFTPGDLRRGGQALKHFTGQSAPPHYDYQINGEYVWKRGAVGLDAQPVQPPTFAPDLTVHGELVAGSYWLSLSYLTGNNRETARSQPIKVSLTGNQKGLIVFRHDPPPVGVKGMYVYLGASDTTMQRVAVPCPIGQNRGYVWPLYQTFFVGRPGSGDMASTNATVQAVWQPSKLHGAMETTASEIEIDEDVTLDSPLIIPTITSIPNRRIFSRAYKSVSVPDGMPAVINLGMHIWLENFQVVGGDGIVLADPANGRSSFFLHFTKMNIRPTGPNWLIADNAYATCQLSDIGQEMYGHTGSECWFNDCYCQREEWLAGNQTVNFFHKGHRQDVLGASSRYGFETAGLHADANKFLAYDYWGIGEGMQTVIDMNNSAGMLAIDVQKLYVDKGVPWIVTKRQETPGKLRLAFSTANYEAGCQGIACVPDSGKLALHLDSFIHAMPKAFGNVKVFSVDPSEASAITVVNP